MPGDPILGLAIAGNDGAAGRVGDTCPLLREKPLLDRIARAVDFHLQSDANSAAGAGAQRLDALAGGGVLFEDNGVDRIEERRLAELVRLADHRDAIADGVDRDTFSAEFPDVLEGQGAQFHFTSKA